MDSLIEIYVVWNEIFFFFYWVFFGDHYYCENEEKYKYFTRVWEIYIVEKSDNHQTTEK
jgi:hypothetical protein